MEQIIYNEDCAKIIYEPELNLLTQSWKREINSEEYRRVFLTSYFTVKEFKIARFISDITKEGFVAPEDRTWLEEELIPKAFKEGLKAAAIVYDPKRYKNYYSQKIMTASKSVGMKFKIFNEHQNAREWILNLKFDD